MGKIKLLSNEGEGFELDTEVAKKSEVIKEMLENCDDSSEDVPLPTISSDQLRKVVQWLEQHRGDVVMDRLKGEDRDYNSDNIPEWDKKFFNLSQVELFDLILAANYLDIKDMLDLLAKSVANMMKGKTAQEIRETFSIDCDLTEEEIEKIQNENEWEMLADN
eukprot:TRINITY_DN54360_c0_g1_i1.p1 TRINITY_DN54360_c0_g1~~TRINITY_DN54360_c0_g1_i1.p1  ORF type:complete len:163 (+),score=71.73 TRINITY_DN54360_c0_g1_i1:38-526(+)